MNSGSSGLRSISEGTLSTGFGPSSQSRCPLVLECGDGAADGHQSAVDPVYCCCLACLLTSVVYAADV